MDPLEHLSALAGAWETEGWHPLLPGEVIRGRATFEWLDGGRFLISRSHYDHPQIPDAVAVTGVVDDRLSMHYFDSRGIHRLYSVSATPDTWSFWRDDPDMSQRFVGTFDDGGRTIAGRGSMARDGGSWEDDLQLTYRRAEQATSSVAPCSPAPRCSPPPRGSRWASA